MGVLAVVALGAACVPTILLPVNPPNGGASQEVDPSGGVVTTDEGTTLVVPAYALDADITVTIALDPDAVAPAGLTPVTAAHVFGPEGQTFGTPVCITLAFQPGLLPDGTTQQNVVLYSAPIDGGPGSFVPMPTVGTDPTHVTGMTTHFSIVYAAYGGDAGELPPDAAEGCEAGEGGAEE